MKTRVIVNLKSANGRTGQQWKKREPLLFSKLGTLEVVFTTGPGEATALTRQALLGGFQRIIAVGGDGTVNEVVTDFFFIGKSKFSILDLTSPKGGKLREFFRFLEELVGMAMGFYKIRASFVSSPMCFKILMVSDLW